MGVGVGVGVGSVVNKTWSLKPVRRAYNPCTCGPHMDSPVLETTKATARP